MPGRTFQSRAMRSRNQARELPRKACANYFRNAGYASK
jgi:hypothetical protein